MPPTRLTSLFSALLLLGACAVEPDLPEASHGDPLGAMAGADGLLPGTAQRTDETEGVDYVFYPGEPMKHAYRDPMTMTPAKADWADDVRWANPERFAITEAPTGSYRAMVEWEDMEALLLGYPGDMSGYDGVTGTVVGIAKYASTVAEVWIIVDSNSAKNFLTGELLDAGVSAATINNKIRFLLQPLDSIWLIDYGPLPLVDPADGSYAFADFRYYHGRPLDDGLSTWIGRELPAIGQPGPVDTYRMPINTEGGTFQATSDGICFTGNRQLYYMSCDQGGCDNSIRFLPLSQVQNHPLALELKAVWAEYAGCVDTIVTNSITDDGTGHIDMYLKVIDDDTVLMGNYPKPYANTAQQTNDKRLDDNAAFIASYTKPNGKKFVVKRLVMPGHKSTSNGAVPFTYINSTFINGMNLWPATTYSDWVGSRNEANATWSDVMPDWEHIWIDSTEISFWSGAVHCITRTVPAQSPTPWIGDGTCQGDTCSAPAGGYDGVCHPNDVAEAVCYGPEWKCTCNDCSTGCGYEGTTPEGCDGITYEGCCDGDALTYCDGGSLKGGDCNGSCGWDKSNNWYDCGFSGADPSGQFPLSCGDVTNPCTPSCAGMVCGDDGCGGSCGSCGANQSCDKEGQCVDEACVPSCAGKACGNDGCGGSCGSCLEGSSCNGQGKCVEDDTSDPCGGLSFEGICDDGYVAYCNDGKVVEENCQSGCCGWYPSDSWFWCYTEEYCGYCVDECQEGEIGCSLEGTHAWSCDVAQGAGCNVRTWSFCVEGCDEATSQCVGVPTCTADCAAKDCGDDGCGGSCGSCVGDTSCDPDGQCVVNPCMPLCDAKDCGDDGCGGSCGTCDVGATCNSKGICDAGPVCVPNCEEKQCGDDGCDGLCGSCVAGASCDSKGKCVEDGCLPLCDQIQCGGDGCGGLCGTCGDDESCEEGACVALPCKPVCDGKSCGDDGCEGSCGTCQDGQICNDLDQCEIVDGCGGITFEGECNGSVVVWCDDNNVESFDCATVGKSCGYKDGSGYTCIAEDPTCVPDCNGKQCGEDGCGKLCGTCPADEGCEEGLCVDRGIDDPDPVDPIDPEDPIVDPPDDDPKDPDVTNPGTETDDGGTSSSGCDLGGTPTSPAPLAWTVMALLALGLRRRVA